jgi:DNA-binding NarL/FixJ family response regulator
MTHRFAQAPFRLDYEQPFGSWSRATSPRTGRNSPTTARASGDKVRGSRDKSISILLIEDNRLFRIGLASLLKKQKGLKLLASSAQPDVIPQLGPWQRPDVILLDLGLGDRGSIEVVRGIRQASPESRLIAMGLIPVKSEILGLVKEGVAGFVLKDASIADFVTAIRAVAAGRKVFPASLTESLLSQILDEASRKGRVEIGDVKMTSREREIVDLITDGLSNKEIGTKLNIATDTVKSHVHNILEKLSLRSRVQVAARGRAPVSTDR